MEKNKKINRDKWYKELDRNEMKDPQSRPSVRKVVLGNDSF